MWRDLPRTFHRELTAVALALAACDSSGTTSSGSADTDARTPEPADAAVSDGALDASASLDAGSDSTTDATFDNGRNDASTHADAAPAFSCTVQPPTGCPDPAPTYADVEPIFRERCVICHSPLWTGPWPLDAYEHVADWQSDIRSSLLDCSMPPRDAGVPIPADESMVILQWLRCGLPK